MIRNSDVAMRHVYVLLDPRNHKLFYVGKANDYVARLRQHCKPSGVTKRENRIREIIADGQFPVMRVITSVMCTEAQILEVERNVINHAKELTYLENDR